MRCTVGGEGGGLGCGEGGGGGGWGCEGCGGGLGCGIGGGKGGGGGGGLSDGGGGLGDGGGGEGKGGLTFADSREITRMTVMPRRVLAASGVEKLLLSACITRATVVPASRVIEAVMRTLAASTLMSTAPELTPAAVAMELCRPEMSA